MKRYTDISIGDYWKIEDTDCKINPYSGLSKTTYNDNLYNTQKYFDMYRWHITDPIYFKKDLRVTIQALGWRSGKRYLPLQDDISSVAYWYSDNLEDDYPEMPAWDGLELT